MENKRNNFIRISENRTQKIVSILKQLGNLTNNSFYEYNEIDIQKLFSLIEEETKKTKDKLLEAKSKKQPKKIVL